MEGKESRIIITIYLTIISSVSCLENIVVKRHEKVILTCDEPLESAVLPSLTVNVARTSLVWFFWPWPRNGTRNVVSDCKEVHKNMPLSILPASNRTDDLKCRLTNKDSEPFPPGTYDCIIVSKDVKIRAEVVVIDDDPKCSLLIEEDSNYKTFPFNTNISILVNTAANTNNSNETIGHEFVVYNNTRAQVLCSMGFRGRLSPNVEVTVDDKSVDPHRNYSQTGQSFEASLDFKLVYKSSRWTTIAVTVTFNASSVEPNEENAATNVPSYKFSSSLIARTATDYDLTRSGVSILAVLPVSILVVILIVVILVFSACYCQMNKKIQSIQGTNISGGSVLPALREERANSVYDEINPEDELQDCHAQYLALHDSTKSKGKTTYTKIDGNRSSDGNVYSNNLQNEYLNAHVNHENVYLDLTESTRTSDKTLAPLLRVVRRSGIEKDLDENYTKMGKRESESSYLELVNTPITTQPNENIPDSMYIHFPGDTSDNYIFSNNYSNTNSGDKIIVGEETKDPDHDLSSHSDQANASPTTVNLK